MSLQITYSKENSLYGGTQVVAHLASTLLGSSLAWFYYILVIGGPLHNPLHVGINHISNYALWWPRSSSEIVMFCKKAFILDPNEDTILGSNSLEAVKLVNIANMKHRATSPSHYHRILGQTNEL